MLEYVLITVIKSLVILLALLLMIAYATLMERRVIAHLQVRVGPNRVGPWGLFQPFADGIKLFFKEDVVPSQADRAVFFLAPGISLAAAFATFAVIPFGNEIQLFGRRIALQLADINIGLLYVFAISSLGVYGLIMGAWASNSKYPILGGLRSAAQMVSYELCLVFSVIGVLMISRSVSLSDVVASQSRLWFLILQPVGFLIFLIASFAEVNRLPFDLPEAENELVAGFHTEYGSMKFAMFFLGEYGNMIAVSAMVTTLYLGGWHGPFLPPVVWFLGKVAALMFLFIWVRGTLPRFRYDQLMKFGWKVLLPVSLANIIVTGLILALID
ncbi:MAG: NADH-quinone oxidoreductase subunit NuoH [Candidatus Eiseniibacteriota bacterium]|nr:MAG: NADH-quinone oxidoreductase subunit NuoH [Candidatus Eisenbacteria bacterium]